MAAPNIHDLDSNVQDILKLKTFEGKFDVKEFVGSVSEKLIIQSKADPGPFDPKPFIRTFESAVDKLISIRKEVSTRSEQLEKGVKVAEREYSKKMAELNRGFESVGTSFSGMESKMNEVGQTAIRIGEQLESIHVERQRAQAAYDIIESYNQFARGDTSKMDTLRKERGREGRRQCAVILRRLAIVVKEVDLPSGDKTREAIDKYCEKFEKDLLGLFDKCYRRGDPKMMSHCAQTLLDFNGGASCVQIYVNQHDFFINRVRETNKVQETQLWELLPDPNATPPKTEAGLLALFREIRTTVGQEAQIVQAVFPNPALVMQVFLQRVFSQTIQQYFEFLLNKGSLLSELASLRVLQLVHAQTTTLIEDLKSYEVSANLPRSPAADTSEFRRSLSAPMSNASSGVTSLSTMLESAMEELFIPYTEGQRYLERESRSLGTLYSGLLFKFTKYHEKTQKGKASVFDRVVNQLSAAAATSGSSAPSTGAQAAAALMRFGGIGTTQEKNTEDPVQEEDGQLSLDAVESMLKWHAEAVGRCVELTPTNDVPKHAFALLRVLAAAIGTGYIEAGIETANARLDTAATKAEPNLQPLNILRSVDLICHLWQQYVGVVLLPLANSSVTVRREMVVFNNQTVSRIEGATNILLQRTIDAVISWLSTQLAKQKKNDYKPRNDDLSFARVNTEPCEACCDLLEKVRDSATANLGGKNLELFLTEIGVAFHTLLLDHFKKFPVSDTGGLMLAKDLKSYQDIVATFGISPLSERFEFIRQLGNVFLVQPAILKSYITENYLGRIDPVLLRPYLMQRADWAQIQGNFDGMGDDLIGVGSPSVNSMTGDLRDRLNVGRLSVLMKDMKLDLHGKGLHMPRTSMHMNLPPMQNIATSLSQLSARSLYN